MCRSNPITILVEGINSVFHAQISLPPLFLTDKAQHGLVPELIIVG